MEKKLELEREKIELEKQEAMIKWKLEKAKTFGDIELEKERLQLARGEEDARIILVDEPLLDEHAKKWLVDKKMRSTTIGSTRRRGRLRPGCMRRRLPGCRRRRLPGCRQSRSMRPPSNSRPYVTLGH